MATMLRVARKQSETVMGVHGATLTATARTTTLRASAPFAAGIVARVAPVRVDVLDATGRHHVTRIRDLGLAIRIAIVTTGTLLVCGRRALRRRQWTRAASR
jgi:hypothetical protein